MEYLQVLGVDVWLPRRPNAAAAPPKTPVPASDFQAAPIVEAPSGTESLSIAHADTASGARSAQPSQPIVRESTTLEPSQPIVRGSSTSAPPQPIVRDSTISAPSQPTVRGSSTSAPSQPVVRGSSTSEPSQPIARDSTTSAPSQPIVRDSTIPAPSQPIARDSTTSPPPLFAAERVLEPAAHLRARESAPDAEAQWAALRAEVLACTKCTLHSTRTQGVFGVGDPTADWLVIGEAPGAEEDRRGEPFVGRGGQLLDAMLRGIGLKRGDNLYIANILKSRPPNNRDPKPEEVVACLPYLRRQIALIQPRIILAVGRIAAQNILSTDVPLGRLRGKVHHFGELNTPLIVTYHPAYLLRSPSEKRKAWEDLKFARGLYRQLTAQAS